MSAARDAALALAHLGLDCFPVMAGEKRPAVAGWQTIATTEPAVLHRLFAQKRGNVGVATGARSRVWVLDVDVKAGAGGLDALATLQTDHGALPSTWCSTTPSGGLHLWWRYPRDRRIGNRVGFARGLDVRGDGGFAVVPPSRIGHCGYHWKVEPDPEGPAVAPDWLPDLAAPLPRPSPCAPLRASGALLDRYVEATFRGELERVETSRHGTRNHALFVASCALGSLVGARLLALGIAQGGLLIAAEICGLVHDDGRCAVEATITSGMTRGIANPRGAPQ